MQWQLVQGRGIASTAIGWFGGGGYSHIDVITPRGTLRGARSDYVGGQPPGYWDRTPNYEPWLKRTVFTLHVTVAQELDYWKFSWEQIGKPYDKRGILGFAFGVRDWHNPNSWFCSEQVAANLEAAGILPPLFEDAWRVDPGDIAFILCALGATHQDLPCQ